MQSVFWADKFFNLVGSGGYLLLYTRLELEADLLSLPSAEFKKTRGYDCNVPMHIYEVLTLPPK